MSNRWMEKACEPDGVLARLDALVHDVGLEDHIPYREPAYDEPEVALLLPKPMYDEYARALEESVGQSVEGKRLMYRGFTVKTKGDA